MEQVSSQGQTRSLTQASTNSMTSWRHVRGARPPNAARKRNLDDATSSSRANLDDEPRSARAPRQIKVNATTSEKLQLLARHRPSACHRSPERKGVKFRRSCRGAASWRLIRSCKSAYLMVGLLLHFILFRLGESASQLSASPLVTSEPIPSSATLQTEAAAKLGAIQHATNLLLQKPFNESSGSSRATISYDNGNDARATVTGARWRNHQHHHYHQESPFDSSSSGPPHVAGSLLGQPTFRERQPRESQSLQMNALPAGGGSVPGSMDNENDIDNNNNDDGEQQDDYDVERPIGPGGSMSGSAEVPPLPLETVRTGTELVQLPRRKRRHHFQASDSSPGLETGRIDLPNGVLPAELQTGSHLEEPEDHHNQGDPSMQDNSDDYGGLGEPEATTLEATKSIDSSSNPGGQSANLNDTANSTSNTCEELESIVQTRPSESAGKGFIVAYSVIFFAGLFGNVITLYVLVCKGKKRSAQDFLLGNLAISDIMLCVFAVPITPKYLVLDHYWKMGPILCKLVSFTQSVSVYMSTYSLIAIGYIRYRLIVHPLDDPMSKRGALQLCAGTLIIGMLTTAPYVMKVHLSPENCEVKFCDEAWVGSQRFYFSLFTFIFQFVIPLVAVIFFYFSIYRQLDHRTNARISSSGSGGNTTSTKTNTITNSSAHPTSGTAGGSGHSAAAFGGHLVGGGHSNHNCQQLASELASGSGIHTQAGGVLAIKEIRQRERQRRMKKNNMRLIFVVIIFAHSWLPLNLYNILSDYFDGLSNWAYLTNAFLVAHLIACSSVIWNPILYAWMSDSYQMDLKCAMPKCLAAKFKSCLKEPAAGAGGHCGGPTSILMVSTNGNNQLHANPNRYFDFRPGRGGGGGAGAGDGIGDGGLGASATDFNVIVGSNPNGLADLAGPSYLMHHQPPRTRARSIDQLSEVCLHNLDEQRRELCDWDTAGTYPNKSLKELEGEVEAAAEMDHEDEDEEGLGEDEHLHCCHGALTDQDDYDCDSVEHDHDHIHLDSSPDGHVANEPSMGRAHFFIDVCRQRARLSNGDNDDSRDNTTTNSKDNIISSQASNNIKPHKNNNNTTAAADNNGPLQPWASSRRNTSQAGQQCGQFAS